MRQKNPPVKPEDMIFKVKDYNKLRQLKWALLLLR
jgi:hypothetical protein